MKLLIVGSDKIYAIENFYVKYLLEAGISVKQFSAQSLFYDFYQKNLQNKLWFKSGLSRITSMINERFLQQVEEFKPDIIWIFKGMEILPASLKTVKEKGICLVNYNPDSPFVFSGTGSGNENITASIRFYDLFLTYNYEDKLRMEREHHIRSAILPFGFNLDENIYKIAINEAEKQKLCFLGNPDRQRAFFLESLADAGLVMDVFGNGWGRFVNHNNITVNKPVYENDFWITLRRYRIQLNLMRPHNPSSHNMRSFEAAGVGAIQLAPDTHDHHTYFEPGEEIFLYHDLESCFKAAKSILSLSPDDALAIRNSTRSRSLKDEYTYKSRAVMALNLIKEYCA